MRFPVAALLLVVLAGCVQPSSQTGGDQGPANGGDRAGPQETGYGELVEFPSGFRGVNMTGCIAERAIVRAPTQTVREHLPPAYEPLESTPGTVGILLEARVCEKIAIDGRDVGTGSLQSTRLGIMAPSTNPPTGASSFVFELRSSSKELVEYLKTAGIAAVEATSERTATPINDDLYSVSAETRSHDASLYSWAGVSVRPTLFVDSGTRYYFGPDPARPTIDRQENYTQSSQNGGVVLSFAPQTILAPFFPGVTQMPADAISVRNQSGLFVVN